MEEAQLKLFLLFVLVNSVLGQQVLLSSSLELSALYQLRSSLGIKARYWPRNSDPCSNWTGVECLNGRVSGIDLTGLSRTRIGRLNPQFAIDSLANCKLLVSFNSSGFLLPGPIPDWLGQNLSALQVLDLRSSSITGPIPASLGDLNRLGSLFLSGNRLTGIIPNALGQLGSLGVMDLSHNLLTGSIPSSISALRNLSKLDLSSNFLSGPIPPGFGSLSSLQFLNLSNNSLAASIPVQLGNLSQLIELDLGVNSLSGLLPEELGGLRRLRKLLIGNNSLEGPFTLNLTMNLPSIQVLDASVNKFTGTFQNLTTVLNASSAARLNFSNNQFYGNLTSPLPNFNLIDLSNNYLEGSEPSTVNRTMITGNCFFGESNQRSLDDCRMFYTQKGLTFDGGPINTLQPTMRSPRKSRNRLIYILAGVIGGIGFIVVLVLLLMLKRCKKRNPTEKSTANVGPVPEEGKEICEKISVNLAGLGDSFTYEQIRQATSDFSDSNLIKHGHSGDLFTGILESGLRVVIKRVDLHSTRKDTYMLELEFYSKFRHTRLVPLLGHCLEHETEKLLVYKSMPNGDLSNSLYRLSNLEDDGLQSLDWITRLKIAIGAAEALCYLHHECDPPLVHRDIQASSILLDDRYDVRLGSLSEVCVQELDSSQNVITRIMRISQTSEQVPNGSSPSCPYDVYCFGKVLLELVTGKLGISESEAAATKEWWDQTLHSVNIDDKELMSKIVDPSLVIDDDLLEEVWAVAIVAKSCLNPKPSKRPLMRHILKALENPFRVVREETFSSERLRTTSSRRSWSAAFFGSWNQNSFGSANISSQTNSGMKLSLRVNSRGSGTNGRRLSSEIFPEPTENEDIEER